MSTKEDSLKETGRCAAAAIHESAAKALAAERAWQDGYIHPNYDVMRLHNARVKAVRVLTGTEPNRVVGWLSFIGLGIVLFVLYAVFA